MLTSDPSASVLGTTDVTQRCYYCFNKGAPLERCSGCKFARYCSRACQRASWTSAYHNDECKALQHWFRHAQESVRTGDDLMEYEPGATIRALALILWQRRREGAQSAVWAEVRSMQAHALDQEHTRYEELARVAYRLARFVCAAEERPGPDALAPFGVQQAADLIALLCRVCSTMHEPTDRRSTRLTLSRSLTPSSTLSECA